MDPAKVIEQEEIEKNLIIQETIQQGESNIQKFYKDAVIFVTGGSGFIGKQLIEKLLRACNVKMIYVMLRPKKEKTVEERFTKWINDPVFDCLRTMNPNFSKKVTIVTGDVNEISLGMKSEDQKILIDEVNIIFHAAATTSFTEPLKKATFTNIRGTREVLQLAEKCKKLISFIHISSTYCQGTKSLSNQSVLEQFYPAPMKPELMIELAEELNEDTLDGMTPTLIGDWPNTYSFTKAIAEELVRCSAGKFPIAVVRPAIVICALREPVPGWIDPNCIYGASGLIAGTGLGILRVMNSRLDVKMDWVPVDLVNNAILIAGHATAVRWKDGERDIKIYSVTGARNKETLGFYTHIIETDARKVTTDKAIWYNFMIQTQYKPIFILLFWLMHYIPAYLVDGILLLMRKRPMFVKVYDKAYKYNNAFSFYLMEEWKFDDENLYKMYNELSPEDQVIFNCDVADICWKRYILLWGIGIRKYIIKDGLNRTEYAVKKQFWLKILHFVLMPLYIYCLFKIFCIFYSVLRVLVSLIFQV